MNPLHHGLSLLFLCLFSTGLYAQTSTQIGQTLDAEAAGDQFGLALAISPDGTRLISGANSNDGNGNGAGHARVFEFDGTNWVQLGADIDGEAVGDRSGISVAINANGSRVAVGANVNDGNGSNSGHVRVFQFNGTNWVQLGADIDGAQALDRAGTRRGLSMSSSGDRVIIGAQGHDSNRGHARVFEWTGSAWSQVGQDLDGVNVGDACGIRGVSMSDNGNRVAVGSEQFDGVAGINTGHVRMFEFNGTSWVQMGSPIEGDVSEDRAALVSMSGDGNRITIGTSRNDAGGTNAGQVRAFEWNGTNWVQMGTDILGTANNEQLNHTDLSTDGSVLVIGAIGNAQNGTNSGQIQVFDWTGTAWLLRGTVEGSAGDALGREVSISGDGSRIAVNSSGAGIGGQVSVWNVQRQNSIVPTLSQWGLILLALLVLAMGSVVVWKRRKDLITH